MGRDRPILKQISIMACQFVGGGGGAYLHNKPINLIYRVSLHIALVEACSFTGVFSRVIDPVTDYTVTDGAVEVVKHCRMGAELLGAVHDLALDDC